jgi:hypothetical protein
MKANHSIMLVVIFICFCLIFAASAWSVERKSSSGKQITSPAATATVNANPAAIKKLPSIIKIDKSLVNARYQNKNLGQEFYYGWKQVTDNYNLMPNKIAAAEQATNVLNQTLDACGSKNFTQSDQKNAGCFDTDTLESCTNKLMSACIMPDYNKFAKSILDMAATLQKLRDAADATYKLLPTSAQLTL